MSSIHHSNQIKITNFVYYSPWTREIIACSLIDCKNKKKTKEKKKKFSSYLSHNIFSDQNVIFGNHFCIKLFIWYIFFNEFLVVVFKIDYNCCCLKMKIVEEIVYDRIKNSTNYEIEKVERKKEKVEMEIDRTHNRRHFSRT